MARWFIARHSVFLPQEPMQGSMHFSRTHALSFEQSSLIEHSGEQWGGTPMYPVLQLQDADPSKWRHTEYGPQGFGSQGNGAKVNFSSLVHLINGSPSNPSKQVQ